ncbi:hypothetical protein Nepgr_030415 [Nepenthes gracilis]|uniref:Reticulon-like protein n=1 Tax=Nepenthes gracilis TaxID=150966 RepID=A0AAD3Y3V2_NEPGR|nr:hypothetical protein Nepgr_030415 [Nepenthes gracilis]
MTEFSVEDARTCVVIGGLGFIGRSLILRLLKLRSWIVRIADSSPPSILVDQKSIISDAISSGRASYFQVDVRDKSQVIRALDGSSVVFHMGNTDPSAHDTYQCYLYIVQGTKNVIAACQECNVKSLIYNSSADVIFDGLHGLHYVDESLKCPWKYEDMLNEFKAQADALFLIADNYDGLRTCVLRPSNVFGPADPYIVPFLVNQANSFLAKLILGTGDNLCDFTYVENVSHAHICAAESLASETVAVAGKEFYITNLEPMKYWEFVSRIYEGLGYKRPMIKLPARICRIMPPLVKWLRNQLGSEFSHQLASAHFAIQSASFTRTFNCSAAQEHIRYLPIISLEEGIGLTVKSFSHLAKESTSAREIDFCEQSKVEKLLGGGKVADILLWRDEKETFTYFLALVLLFYWVLLGGRTFISSASQFLLLAILLLFVHNILPMNIGGFSFQEMPLSSFQISDSGMKYIFGTLACLWNEGIHITKSLAQGEDWDMFLKVAIPLYLLKLILSLPLKLMVAAASVIAFTSFFTYEQYEEEFDAFVKVVCILGGNLKMKLMRNLPAPLSPLFQSDEALY